MNLAAMGLTSKIKTNQKQPKKFTLCFFRVMFALIIQVCTRLFAWISLKNISSIPLLSFFKPKLMTTNLLSSTEYLYVLTTFQSIKFTIIYKAVLSSEATDDQHHEDNASAYV